MLDGTVPGTVPYTVVPDTVPGHAALDRALFGHSMPETASQGASLEEAMGILQDKVILVTGIANSRSIAYATAQVLAREGASLVITYQPRGPSRQEAKFRSLLDPLAPTQLLPLDVEDTASVAHVFESIAAGPGRLDGMLHAIASAERDELGGAFHRISRRGYLHAQAVSAYSLIALARAAKPLLTQGSSIVALTYIGACRAAPNYHVMGPAKAALEANIRYLAEDLGPLGIRVNGVSAGPIRTLASAGISDFLDTLHQAAERAPLRRNITANEVAEAVAFLVSARASGITGQQVYVDGGYVISGN